MNVPKVARLLAMMLCLFASPALLAQTLHARVAEAPAGAVVTVAAGVHHVHLVIDRPLTLRGEPGAVLDGDGHGNVIRIAASHVTVSGLTVRDSGTSLTDMNAGIYVDRKARFVTIKGNHLRHVLFGIYLDGPSDVRVADNTILGMTGLRRPDRGDGIHLWNDRRVLVRGNTIRGTRDGIYIYVSPHNRLIGNHIEDVRYGIHWMYSNHDLAEANSTDRDVAGYALMQSNHLVVRGNRSRHDESYGMLLNYVTYSRIVGNVITAVLGEGEPDGVAIPGAQGKGLFVYNSEFNLFRDNVISRCPIGVHFTAGSDHNRIYDNAFIHNRIQVKYVQNYEEEWSHDRTGNYWSDYLGWDMNGDGRGDTPFRPNSGVDRLLWKYPLARLLMNSPAIIALRYVQRAFPVFAAPGIKDSYPLMSPPAAAVRLAKEDRHGLRG